MENPCFVSDGEGGELRRWRSLPVKHQVQPVATIYRPEAFGATKPKPQQPPPRPHTTLLSALLLATLITLAATAALVCLLRAVHARYTPAAVVPGTWSADMVVLGEFRVSNEPYRESLSNMTSTDFKQLATKIGTQLEKLFRESLMSDRFITAAVIRFSEGLKVYCSLLLHPTDPLTVSKVGLAFLGGLTHAHGHLWLGPYIIDVQSIGFQASTEEVTWSQWSQWSDCSGSGRGRMVRTRKRVCLSLASLKTTSRTALCQDGSLQGISDTETELCPESQSMKESQIGFPATTEVPTQTSVNLSNGTQILDHKEEEKTPPVSGDLANAVANETHNSSITADQRTCSNCLDGEVCVALEEELVPYCRPSLDPADPTGCGGLCKISTEVCYHLRDNAYRCVDDSKCLEDEWQCGNKLCIPSVKRCDGHFNCYDHTDEYDCDCDLKSHFHCGKNSSCLPKLKKCDGIVDCWDAADEVNCTVACLDSAQFTCNDSQCIPSKNFCDGYPDCKDRSDEPFGCGGVCKNHEWRCSNGRCIARRDVCNNADDCGDGSDEAKCGKRKNIL